MHGPAPHHNPLSDAARQLEAAARRTKWRWLEWGAMGLTAAAAGVTTVIGFLQLRHLYRRELKEEERERERERRAEGAAPPPERPGHGGATTSDMPPQGDGRWARREEHAQAAGHARGR